MVQYKKFSWAVGVCVIHYGFLNGTLVMHQQPAISSDKQYLPLTISSLILHFLICILFSKYGSEFSNDLLVPMNA